ncbi:MAG: valine--tRNA ligase [Deltaproteobacteria bacterium]|nr:valine--tRNA ligase [Deltaproteobacteria bacterium]
MPFPKNYDHKDVEPRLQKRWHEEGIYKFDPADPRPIFSVDTPPPYVSAAHLHVGHAMSYSQAEFIVRYKRMRGFNVFYPMGFDDNGLPTERYVEKKYKIDKSKISREEFIELCLKETRDGAKVYRDLWEAMAISVDWDLTYSTISPRAVKTAQMSFLDLYKKGLIERREDPVAWSFALQSSVAQAEIDTVERTTLLNDIAFKGPGGENLIISTTRPELIPACVALYCNPEDERYLSLVGKKAHVPLFDYEVEIRTHEDVAKEFGTGLMMVCTWGDAEDVKKWKEDGLETRFIFTEYGKLNDMAGPYAGMKPEDARKAILNDLNEAGLLLKQKEQTQFVGIHDRSGVPVEFNHSPQWFIKVMPFVNDYLKRSEELNWFPEHFKTRLDHWIEGLKWDWCISRQRFYGVPFPVWYDEETGEPIVADESMLPIDPTMTQPPESLTKGRKVRPEPDVMDTWMTSSLSPLINANWAFENDAEHPNLVGKIYPMSIRVQAFEIIRTWLFYTLVKSHHHTDSLPWSDVMISGWGLDAKGKKMSKSAGNFVDPGPVIEKYGADAVRYWAAGATLGHDLRYNERDVANGKKLMTKLWNASKFVGMQLKIETEGDESWRELMPGTPTMIDRWVVSRLQQVIDETTKYFDKYEYSHALAAVERFFFSEFCDNYIEIVKERFWNPDQFDEGVVEAARHTLATVNLTVLKLMAPVIPYITDEIYRMIYQGYDRQVSVHVAPWPESDAAKIDADAVEAGRLLIAVLTGARRWKTTQQVNPNFPLAKLTVSAPEAMAAKLSPLAEDLKAAAHADELDFAPGGEIETEIEEIKLACVLGEKKPRSDGQG